MVNFSIQFRTMNKFTFIVLFLCSACFAQGKVKLVKPLAVHEKEGETVYSYDFNNFENRLHKENDTIYVVNFWATWCAPCVKELPYYEKLNSEYKGKKVKVLLVSLDMKKQVEAALLPFIKKKKLKSEVIHLHDPNADAWISRVDPSWSGALPATVIYSRGKRKFYEQTFTYEQLENEVKQFIN
jgi:thiol-disulfide isomerase/thioredoxin